MRLCEIQVHGKACAAACVVQPSGRFGSMYRQHFLAHHNERKARTEKDRTDNFTQDDEEILNTKKKNESIKRMNESVQRRKAELNAIDVQKVHRIAMILDRIKSKEAYVMVPNAIEESVIIKSIKTYGPKLPITFTGEEPPFK